MTILSKFLLSSFNASVLNLSSALYNEVYLVVTARKLLENFPRTLAICLIVTLDVIKVFSQVSWIALFFLLDKETDMLLIESVTNPRHSVFWVDMNWDFVGCITIPKVIII